MGSASELVPVIGSTAAGPARFWREMLNDRTNRENWGDEANQRLQQLFEECSQRALATDARLVRDAADPLPDSTAALIQFSHPDDLGLVEFLSCPGIDTSHVPLVGWRIDGESMMPRYRDGDFVLVSPEQSPTEGFPCVAHQHGQIGVNCKIFKRDGADVVLIPVNEAYAAQRFPASELAWATACSFRSASSRGNCADRVPNRSQSQLVPRSTLVGDSTADFGGRLSQVGRSL